MKNHQNCPTKALSPITIQRQGDAQSDKQVGENGNDPLQQGAHNQKGQTDDRHRVDQGRLDGGAQLDGFFDVDGQALQNDVENTASFTGFDHVGSQVIENLRITLHRVSEGSAAFDRGPHSGQGLLERRVFLIGCQNFETLHQRKASVDHDRELPEENGNVLGLDATGSESWHDKLFAFFPDRARRNALAPQLGREHLFVGSSPLAADFLSGRVLTRKCKNWHGESLLAAIRFSGGRLYSYRL
jgi:hypothetical protein